MLSDYLEGHEPSMYTAINHLVTCDLFESCECEIAKQPRSWRESKLWERVLVSPELVANTVGVYPGFCSKKSLITPPPPPPPALDETLVHPRVTPAGTHIHRNGRETNVDTMEESFLSQTTTRRQRLGVRFSKFLIT